MRLFLVSVATLCLLGASFLPAAAVGFGTAAVQHALYLQTTGTTAEWSVVEPCTTEGMSDAVRRADSAYENQDATTLSTEQRGFATGFAQCALHATTASNFANFCAATVQSGTQWIEAMRSFEGVTPDLRAHARQIHVIAAWLLHFSYADKVDRAIARAMIAKMQRLKLL